MAHLIDKAAVVAEINRILNSYDPNEITSGRYALVDLRDFLDTLEVTEVDLEKKIQDYWNEHQYSHRLQKQVEDGFGESLIRSVAKHFFELGVNTSNTLTWEDIKLIWTIGDEIPYMPEEDFFKELLKRFKALKGE